MGLSLKEAAQRAMKDLRDLDGDYIGGMNLIALDKDGEHIGLSSRAGGSIYLIRPKTWILFRSVNEKSSRFRCVGREKRGNNSW